MSYKFSNTVETEKELRDLTGYPGKLAENKVIPYLDEHCREFITKSPFLIMSTSDRKGACDVSPRGDGPGFVKVLDDRTLIIPERPGNKRIESMRNILSNPSVGLLFVIPGLNETLRVNGKAVLVKDDDLLEQMTVKGKKPLLAIGVEVKECYIHCAKAFLRSKLWDPSSWEEPSALPDAAEILFAHSKLPGATEESVKKQLAESYTKRLY